MAIRNSNMILEKKKKIIAVQEIKRLLCAVSLEYSRRCSRAETWRNPLIYRDIKYKAYSEMIITILL